MKDAGGLRAMKCPSKFAFLFRFFAAVISSSAIAWQRNTRSSVFTKSMPASLPSSFVICSLMLLLLLGKWLVDKQPTNEPDVEVPHHVVDRRRAGPDCRRRRSTRWLEAHAAELRDQLFEGGTALDQHRHGDGPHVDEPARRGTGAIELHEHLTDLRWLGAGIQADRDVAVHVAFLRVDHEVVRKARSFVGHPLAPVLGHLGLKELFELADARLHRRVLDRDAVHADLELRDFLA